MKLHICSSYPVEQLEEYIETAKEDICLLQEILDLMGILATLIKAYNCGKTAITSMDIRTIVLAEHELEVLKQEYLGVLEGEHEDLSEINNRSTK